MKTAIHTTLDGDLLTQAKQAAYARGISLSAIFERALDRYLELLDQKDQAYGRESRSEQLHR